MEGSKVDYELYYYIPWPESQKYMFQDSSTGEDVFTVDDDMGVFVPKDYIDKQNKE